MGGLITLIAAGLSLTACEASPLPGSKVSADVQNSLARHPVGTWTGIHKKDWTNGVEVIVLNTRTGDVCTVFYSNDPADKPDRSVDSVRCQSPSIFADSKPNRFGL